MDAARTIVEGDARQGSGDEWTPAWIARRWKEARALATKGAEADLYLVADDEDRRSVLKVYREGISVNADVSRRVQQSNSRRIVSIEERGETGGRYWERMEHASQGTLREHMDIDLRAAAAQLAEGIRDLHEAGIEHRDLKPENVLVRSSEPLDLAITDFGIATMPESTVHFTDAKGTAMYAPPEALTGLGGTSAVRRNRWDYWSLGMILAEMGAGGHPFQGLSAMAIGYRLATGETGEIADAVRDETIRAACRGLLERDPGRRWGDEEIEAWLEGGRHVASTGPGGGEGEGQGLGELARITNHGSDWAGSRLVAEYDRLVDLVGSPRWQGPDETERRMLEAVESYEQIWKVPDGPIPIRTLQGIMARAVQGEHDPETTEAEAAKVKTEANAFVRRCRAERECDEDTIAVMALGWVVNAPGARDGFGTGMGTERGEKSAGKRVSEAWIALVDRLGVESAREWVLEHFDTVSPGGTGGPKRRAPAATVASIEQWTLHASAAERCRVEDRVTFHTIVCENAKDVRRAMATVNAMGEDDDDVQGLKILQSMELDRDTTLGGVVATKGRLLHHARQAVDGDRAGAERLEALYVLAGGARATDRSHPTVEKIKRADTTGSTARWLQRWETMHERYRTRWGEPMKERAQLLTQLALEVVHEEDHLWGHRAQQQCEERWVQWVEQATRGRGPLPDDQVLQALAWVANAPGGRGGGAGAWSGREESTAPGPVTAPARRLLEQVMEPRTKASCRSMLWRSGLLPMFGTDTYGG